MLSRRVENIAPSATMEITGKIAQLREKGIDIVGLNLGEPDFGTPEHICEAAKKAIDEQKTKYTPVGGITELKKAIAAKLERENNIKYDLSEICVGTGAKQVLVNAILSLCDEGDEVIIPTPCWVSYIEMVKLAGAEPVLVPCKEEDGFALDLPAISSKVTSKTKAIIINTPNNPTGAVYAEESLRELAALAEKNDFYIISDEVYEKLIYGGVKHFSVASISEALKNRVVTINGVSKAYSMTGWRIGYAAAPAKIIGAMAKLQGHTTSNTCSIAQHAALEALAGPQDELEIMRKEFEKRKDFLLERISELKGIGCAKPEGAFYLMPNVSAYYGKSFNGKVLKDSYDITNYLLDQAWVAVVPGDAFMAPDNVRISYSNSMEQLTKAMDRIEKALGRLAEQNGGV